MSTEILIRIAFIVGATVLCLAVLFGLAYRYCQQPLLLGPMSKRGSTSKAMLAPLMWEIWEWFNPGSQRQLPSKLAMVQTQGVMLKWVWLGCMVIVAIASFLLALSFGSFNVLFAEFTFFTVCIIYELVALAQRGSGLPFLQQWQRYRANLKQQYAQMQVREEQKRKELKFYLENPHKSFPQKNAIPSRVTAEEAQSGNAQSINVQQQGATAFTPTLIGIVFLLAVVLTFWLGPVTLLVFTPILGAMTCLVWMVKYLPHKTLQCGRCKSPLQAVADAETQRQLLKPEKVAQSLGSTQYEGVRCLSCTTESMGFNLQLFSQVVDGHRFRCCQTCQAWTLERKVKTLRARTYRRGGLQEIHEHCHCCGKETLRKKRTAKKQRRSSGSGGGGFSGGFGGGSSGGGGAGGSW